MPGKSLSYDPLEANRLCIARSSLLIVYLNV